MRQEGTQESHQGIIFNAAKMTTAKHMDFQCPHRCLTDPFLRRNLHRKKTAQVQCRLKEYMPGRIEISGGGTTCKKVVSYVRESFSMTAGNRNQASGPSPAAKAAAGAA
jgi:hypothetical protein